MTPTARWAPKVGTLNEVLGPRILKAGRRAGRPLGIGHGKVAGDLKQLGGVVVVSKEGAIVFDYLSRDAKDLPANGDVLIAARKAVGASRRRAGRH